MIYIMLFLEGIATFISPCFLPLLPLYIAYFAAGDNGRKRVLVNSLGFVLGFTAVFAMLGVFAGVLGQFWVGNQATINAITGGIVIVFGLACMGAFRFRFGGRGISAKVRNLKFFSAIAFGVVFAISWTPCVGAFLGSALMKASRSASWIEGVGMLVVYSLGLGVPLIASAMLMDRLKGTFAWIKRNYRVINMISGMLLVAIGVLLILGII